MATKANVRLADVFMIECNVDGPRDVQLRVHSGMHGGTGLNSCKLQVTCIVLTPRARVFATFELCSRSRSKSWAIDAYEIGEWVRLRYSQGR
jgi:hypothetical protein